MKTQILTHQQLLEARKEALERATSNALRPIGKWNEMDVFTWHHPDVHELAATLKHFPFPVFWMTNTSILKEIKTHYPELLPNLKWIAQYDSAKFPLKQVEAKSIPLVSATENIEEAIELLKGMKQPKHIVLITLSGGDWVHTLSIVEEVFKKK